MRKGRPFQKLEKRKLQPKKFLSSVKVVTTVVYKRIYFETFKSMLEFLMSCPEAINICN